MTSIRQQKISREILKIMDNLIRFEIRKVDPNVDNIFNFIDFSVTNVEIDRAFTLAQIMFTTSMNDPINLQHYLTSAKDFLRRSLAREIRIKRVPNLSFKYDKIGMQISKIDDNLNSQEGDL
jgi:ribosome-binding factor A